MISLREQLNNITDEKTAGHVITRLLPNMLADMKRMARTHRVGDTISEEYRLDDGSLSIILRATVTADGMQVTDAIVK